jgi:D-arabinose 1-dehydrogenase-like Zn-dependent alcohol dehydrogenase
VSAAGLAWRVEGSAIVEIDDAPPAPGVADVVIAVEAAWLDGGGGGAPVPGGAAVGRVVDGGEQAQGLTGTRVLVGPCVPCGECDVCRRGGAAVCPRGATLGVNRRGTLAARIVVPSRWVVALDGELAVPGPTAAAIAGDLAIAYAMYARSGIGPREPAVIVGDGAVAAFLAQVLAAKGVTPVVVGDDGAEAAIAAAGTGDRPLRLFAATAAACPVAVRLVGPRSVIVARAHPGTGFSLDATALARELTFHAVAGAHPDLLTEIAALVVRGEVTLANAVDVVALADLPASLAPRSRSLVVALPP